jgi:MFS family permease
MRLRLQYRFRVIDLPAPARALLLVELLSLCAASVGHGAVLWWMAEALGAVALTTYSAVLALATLISVPALSPLGDRQAKGRLIAGAQAVLLMVAALLGVTAWHHPLSLGLLMSCGAIAAVAQAVSQPAQSAMLLEALPAEQVAEAIRWRRALQAVGSLCGPALAGLAWSWGQMSLALAVHGALAAASAAVAMTLWCVPATGLTPGREPWIALLKAGWKAKWRVRVDRWWTLSGALMMLFYAPAVGLLLPLRLQSMGASALWMGGCQAALAVGVLVGVFGATDVLFQRMGRYRSMMMAVSLCGLCVAGMSVGRHAPLLALLLAVIGFCISVTQMTGQTVRSLAVPEDFRARMAAAQLTVASVASSCAPLLAAGLLQHGTVEDVYRWAGIGFLASGLLLLGVPGLRQLLAFSPSDAQGWYERHYPHAFVRGGFAPPGQDSSNTPVTTPSLDRSMIDRWTQQ